MKYKVKVNYTEFLFTDADAAIAFAQTAMETYQPTNYDKTVGITITILNEEDNDNE